MYIREIYLHFRKRNGEIHALTSFVRSSGSVSASVLYSCAYSNNITKNNRVGDTVGWPAVDIENGFNRNELHCSIHSYSNEYIFAKKNIKEVEFILQSKQNYKQIVQNRNREERRRKPVWIFFPLPFVDQRNVIFNEHKHKDNFDCVVDFHFCAFSCTKFQGFFFTLSHFGFFYSYTTHTFRTIWTIWELYFEFIHNLVCVHFVWDL